MTLGAVLDVAFGITFFFALLALIASSIQEIIASVLSTRGKVLQQMMSQILSDATPANAPPQPANAAPQPANPAPQPSLANRVLGHPLIASLSTPNLPRWVDRWVKTVPLPSYIPATNFATALIETLRKGQDETLAVGSQIDRAINALPADCPIKGTLQGFSIEAKGDLDALRTRIQTWYDDAMDRASGVYKRYAQYMLLAIGLVLAVAINADVISIADTLWHDKNARDIVASAAQQYIQNHPQPTGTSADTATPQDANKAEAAAVQQLKQATGLISGLPIPIGWDNTADDISANPLLVPRKIIGFLLTAFAVSLGAPFWFDMLQNIANLRGAGPKPARADANPTS